MGTKKQYGVIPYTNSKNGNSDQKVILITSRTSGYWIVPKGNPMKNMSEYKTAEQEAYEEAGVEGTIDKKRPYTMTFLHHKDKYQVTLFPMKVDNLLDKWPEKHERKRQVVSVDRALQMIDFKPLQKCLKNWQQDLNKE